jgi:hypothetical protein
MKSLPHDPDPLDLLEPLAGMKRIKGIKKLKFIQGVHDELASAGPVAQDSSSH